MGFGESRPLILLGGMFNSVFRLKATCIKYIQILMAKPDAHLHRMYALRRVKQAQNSWQSKHLTKGCNRNL